ncbi:MAG: hypothetical protein LBI05_03525 [Planctomycetaceae bacterium]|jgi:hypothetical protein|nr:hypothetical protein [Planctomycetaceae bacterium]
MLILRFTVKSNFAFLDGVSVNQIAESAGLDKILRPFDNTRASCATEGHCQFGAKNESLWIGHSEKIAEQFYLMVTDGGVTSATREGVVGIGAGTGSMGNQV